MERGGNSANGRPFVSAGNMGLPGHHFLDRVAGGILVVDEVKLSFEGPIENLVAGGIKGAGSRGAVAQSRIRSAFSRNRRADFHVSRW